MNNINLLKCPFCGRNPHLSGSGAVWGVSCAKCSAQCQPFCGHKTAQEAADAWNNRYSHIPTAENSKTIDVVICHLADISLADDMTLGGARNLANHCYKILKHLQRTKGSDGL